jgi:mono/diheme cytochrome c family protein
MTQTRSTLLLTTTALVLLGTMAGGAGAPQPKTTPTTTAAARVQHGEYLVKTMGCHDCHTPWTVGPKGPEPDMTRMLSGHPATLVMPPAPAPTGPWVVHSAGTNTAHAGPWGVSFTANLTPDIETGLGEWTEEQFLATIRTGRHQGKGRMILPPMPIAAYRNATDQDLADIFRYLQSIPAIRNKVPAPIDPEE